MTPRLTRADQDGEAVARDREERRMTIPEWIAESRARCEAATKGPWEVHPNPRYYVLLPTDDWGDPNRDGNAAFCAAARTDLPRALEALEFAFKELRKYEETYGGLDDDDSANFGAAGKIQRIFNGEAA